MKQALFAALLAIVPFASGCSILGGKKCNPNECTPGVQGCPPSACASKGEYGPCGTPGYGQGKVLSHLNKCKVRRGGLLEHCYHCSHPPHCGMGQPQCQPAPTSPDGGPAPTGAAVAYPYYTTRGPRDFLLNNPPSIGP